MHSANASVLLCCVAQTGREYSNLFFVAIFVWFIKLCRTRGVVKIRNRNVITCRNNVCSALVSAMQLQRLLHNNSAVVAAAAAGAARHGSLVVAARCVTLRTMINKWRHQLFLTMFVPRAACEHARAPRSTPYARIWTNLKVRERYASFVV